MFLRLKKFFGLETLHPDIQFFLDCSNIRISRIVSVIVMILELITFSVSFIFQVHAEVENPEIWILHHRIAYVVLFLSALQLFFYSFKHSPEKDCFNHFFLNLSIGLFLFVLIVFAMYISILDYILDEQIMVFITLELFLACLFMIKPVISIPSIILSFAVFFLLMVKYRGITPATLINYPILLIFFLVVNITHYQQYLRIAKRTVVGHALAEQLRRASLYDPLTKLKNRNALRIDSDNALNSEVILMLIDIDDFKSYNDNYGHNYGDELLSKFGKNLQDSFGEDFCYRYGGDEFLVMIPDISEEDFKKKLDACIQNIDCKFSGGYTINSVLSSKEIHDFINKADTALYKAKRNGKNQVLRSE
ncbi:MAG: GGDEF domain-containing protein [Treponema sp.]|nr:GGDEF domain-containing protein [Treponema sp.]